MPRSGTSLLEQIISSHSKVYGCGEVGYLNDYLKKFDVKDLKIDEKFLKNILTSGEAAINSIKKNKFGEKFYHLGPQRDDSLFVDVKKNKTSLDKCDYILCTGLFDTEEENLKCNV